MKISVENFWFRYDKNDHDVLRNVSHTFEPGSFTAVIGPNGSGKTTLLKLIAGLVPLDNARGTIKIGELKPDEQSLSQYLTYVPGTIHSPYPISLLEFCVQARYNHRGFWEKPSRSDYLAAESALDKFHLSAMTHVPITSLSSGEKQLALIARGLTQDPKIMILDESLSNLDLHYQLMTLKKLRELNQNDLTVLMVSHDFQFVSEFANHALWMKNGEVVHTGTIAESFNTKLIHQLYPDSDIVVEKNPFTGKPKVFFKPQ